MTTPARFATRATRIPAPGLILALALAAAAPPVRAADAPATPEYQVKAAVLLQAARFVEWPETAFPDAKAPITVGVVGEDPFGKVLEQTFQDATVKNRPLAIRRFADRDALEPCHILFVSRSESDHLPAILKRMTEPAFRAKGPLTVGDFDRFARQGGILRLALRGNRIRIHINVDAANRATMKISSHLLKLATIVPDERNHAEEGEEPAPPPGTDRR